MRTCESLLSIIIHSSRTKSDNAHLLRHCKLISITFLALSTIVCDRNYGCKVSCHLVEIPRPRKMASLQPILFPVSMPETRCRRTGAIQVQVRYTVVSPAYYSPGISFLTLERSREEGSFALKDGSVSATRITREKENSGWYPRPSPSVVYHPRVCRSFARPPRSFPFNGP